MSRSENLTVMFTDIVGYTEQTARLSRAGLNTLLRTHDQVVLPIVEAFGGRRIKAIGDALLIVFRSPTDAVQCGMAIQDALAEKRSQLGGEFDLHLRVALSQGDVRVARNDVHGEAVNVASRIEAITPPDDIYFSEAVYLAMNKAEIPSRPAGTHEFRGIPEKVRVFSVPAYVSPRLVPGAEGPPGTGLPFGGAHLLRSVRAGLRHRLGLGRPPLWLTPQQRQRLRWVGFTMVAVLGLIWVEMNRQPMPPAKQAPEEVAARQAPATDPGEAAEAAPTPSPPVKPRSALRAEVQNLLAQDDPQGLGDWIERNAAENPELPVVVWAQGHLAFLENQREEGLIRYREAIAKEPELAASGRYARNLIGILGWKTAEVEQLINQAPSDEVLTALGRRTGEPGFHGRHHAMRILHNLEGRDYIDWFGYAREEMRSREDCKDRREAVRIFRRLKDPRAIEIIQANRNTGFIGGFKDRCLASEAEATIDELRKLQ